MEPNSSVVIPSYKGWVSKGIRGCWNLTISSSVEARVTILTSGVSLPLSRTPLRTRPPGTSSQINCRVSSERSAKRSAGMSKNSPPRRSHHPRISFLAKPAQTGRTKPSFARATSFLPGRKISPRNSKVAHIGGQVERSAECLNQNGGTSSAGKRDEACEAAR